MNRITATVPFLPRAHQAARRVLGCDHLASDVLQEALLALCRRKTAPPEPGPWLVRAATLRARQQRRTLERRRRHEQHAANCREHPHCANPLHDAAAHELRDRLDAARARLPAAQREVLELQLSGDLGYAEAALQLELPVGTVRSRLSRARAALRAAVD